MPSGSTSKLQIGCVVMLITSSGMDQDQHTIHINICGVRFYIINGSVTRKELDNRSCCTYFMVYAATTRVILDWNPDQPFNISRFNNDWFDEYNYCLSIEHNHIPFSLTFLQYSKILLYHSDLINLITCELDITVHRY